MESQEYFGLRFKQLSCAFERSLQREAERYELTASQACMLIYLSHADHKVNQRELEKYFKLSNPTVTGLMKRMEAKGFLERVASTEDGRYKYIMLTPKAEEVRHAVSGSLAQVEARVTEGMTPEEVAQFHSLMTRALQNVYSCCKKECRDNPEDSCGETEEA